MTDRRLAAIAEMERHIGHVFTDRALLERALTHASVGDGATAVRHNESLEFLGDRVLGLLAAEKLAADHPDWKEGELARRFNRVVMGSTCAAAGRGIGLGPAMRLSGSVTTQGGRDSDKILGDAMEALIAAVYLDAGLGAARAVFNIAWAPILDSEDGFDSRDPKTALQEWAQGRALPLPVYKVVGKIGPDHAPTFTVEAHVTGFAPESGLGSSLRAAEQAAALALLKREHKS